MKKKILFAYNFHREIFSPLENDFELTFPSKDSFNKEEVIEMIRDYDVLVPSFNFYTDSAIVDRAPHLRLIANFGVGYNNIDVDYAASKNIVVTNTPNSVLEPTAELTFGLMGAVARRIGFYNNKLRTIDGLDWGLYANLGVAIYGKTLGIYGMGRIGQAVARRALASGMDIIYHNRTRLDREIEEKYNARYVSFDKLLSQSDFITLNAPATSETFHIIDEKAIAKMKSNAILINAARGTLIDEAALIDALKKNRIFGAGLDVYGTEPHINPAFFELDNVVLTPHAGTQTLEGRHDMQCEVMRNILNFYSGDEINRVN